MNSLREPWSGAFFVQAASDRKVYELLVTSTPPVPACHQLHYLQMWLEKLCKAYLWKQKSSADEFRTKHGVIAKVLPRLISDHWRHVSGGSDIKAIRQLCREIDLLHPQIDDDGRRPDNVEYPWRSSISGAIEAPARWKFALAHKLHTNTGRQLLKAASSLTGQPT